MVLSLSLFPNLSVLNPHVGRETPYESVGHIFYTCQTQASRDFFKYMYLVVLLMHNNNHIRLATK
jgi:hypothetical protein